MRLGWQITSVVMLLICIATGWEAHNLALFDRLGPGPGFFPFWLSVIGAVLCAVILAQVTRTPPTGDDTAIFPRGDDARAAGAILVLTAIGTALLDLIGFRLAIMIFSAGLLLALGDRRWWLIIAFSIFAGFGLFHIFNNWLDVLLPVSEFGV